MRFLAALMLATLALVVSATSAMAGGWATTLLDPLPERLEATTPYTVGYWVLQHGSHPSVIPLGQTGLRFVSDKGDQLMFRGVALPEAAHFVAGVSIPHNGQWTLYGEQPPFGEFAIGKLQVPGRLLRFPVPTPYTDADDRSVWGAIHPPLTNAQLQSSAFPSANHRPRDIKAGPTKSWSAAQLIPAVSVGLLVVIAGLLFMTLRHRVRVRHPRMPAADALVEP